MSAGTKGLIAGFVAAFLLSPLVFITIEALSVFAAWFTWDVLEMRLLGPAESAIGGAVCGLFAAALFGLCTVVIVRTIAVRMLG